MIKLFLCWRPFWIYICYWGFNLTVQTPCWPTLIRYLTFVLPWLAGYSSITNVSMTELILLWSWNSYSQGSTLQPFLECFLITKSTSVTCKYVWDGDNSVREVIYPCPVRNCSHSRSSLWWQWNKLLIQFSKEKIIQTLLCHYSPKFPMTAIQTRNRQVISCWKRQRPTLSVRNGSHNLRGRDTAERNAMSLRSPVE